MADRASGVDSFRVLFDSAPDAMLLADDHRRYVDGNAAACRLLQRSREELLELRVDDVSPPDIDVAHTWQDFMMSGELRGEYRLQRPDGVVLDVEFHATANVLPRRHLSIVRDVSASKRAERERDELNVRLREAHDRVHDIALTLQRAMLPLPVAIEGVPVATRYLPASEAIAVGGDWYDVVALEEHLVALTVGDVMGHGIDAAGGMGQIRSALNASIHAEPSPARTMDILEAYVRSHHDSLIAAAFTALFDRRSRLLTYSNAGHVPPLLIADSISFLDRALCPPLGADPEAAVRPEASLELPAGATIVLYTDGLVERRGRHIDDGLRMLAEVAERLRDQGCEGFADALLAELVPGGAVDDDLALVIFQC